MNSIFLYTLVVINRNTLKHEILSSTEPSCLTKKKQSNNVFKTHSAFSGLATSGILISTSGGFDWSTSTMPSSDSSILSCFGGNTWVEKPEEEVEESDERVDTVLFVGWFNN